MYYTLSSCTPSHYLTNGKIRLSSALTLTWVSYPGSSDQRICAQDSHLPVTTPQVQVTSVVSDSWWPYELSSLLGFFVHGVLQARTLEWVATPSSRGSSQLRNQTHVSCIGRWVLYHCIISAVTVRGNFCLWFSGVPFTHKQLFLFQEITASKCFELSLLPITSGLGRCVLTSAFTSFLLSLVSNSSSAPWNWGLYFL